MRLCHMQGLCVIKKNMFLSVNAEHRGGAMVDRNHGLFQRLVTRYLLSFSIKKSRNCPTVSRNQSM
jgi:hypothetical protein